MACHLVDHPLLRAKLGQLRAAATPAHGFRDALHGITKLLGYEALRSLEEEPTSIDTPLGPSPATRLRHPIFIMPILRAGLGMAEALSHLLPEASIGHIGIYRDEVTLESRSYYFRVPPGIELADVVCVDPMLATGNSTVSALAQLKLSGATRIRMICVVGCPRGVAQVEAAHPDVPIFLAALDPGLDERGYIVPGLGDAGDRYFGT